jgi:3-oxoacyl-[acyl-carrier protein] reductase
LNLEIKDRVAIVTGSSRGIGKAIALGLAMEKAKVAICARDEVSLNQTAIEIASSTGTEILPIKADLTKKSSIKSLVANTVEKFGRVDILINNTGGPLSSQFIETSEKDWREAIDLLLMSVINCCHEVIPYMKNHMWGRIINMTSFAAKQPAEKLILSNTIRAGILGLTKTLSNELAEYGILVNAVCPGWTLTKRVMELVRINSEKSGMNYKSFINDLESKIPLKRLANPEEIASLVLFLASGKASYITGVVFQVDGGFTRSLL